MPIISKYGDDQLADLTTQILALLAQEKAPVDLSMMALGNALSNILNEDIPVAKRQAVAEQIGKSLLHSVSVRG